MMSDLFENLEGKTGEETRPLAERMRPTILEELAGQVGLTAAGSFLAEAIREDRVPSLLLWGPPGCGKTSLAHVISVATRAHFEPFSAVLGGVKDIRRIIEEARLRKLRTAQRTILFVDEIHRFNKSQQDAFLPHVESGAITLIGATTENPSFSINNALLSRCRTLVLESLTEEAVLTLLERALADENGCASSYVHVDLPSLKSIAVIAQGDGRRALGILEEVVEWALGIELTEVGEEDLKRVLSDPALHYDRGDAHYNLVSAFIKSMRGSDPDAALYYMCRMLEGGEDPLFLMRRVIVFASEDIGTADPRALQVAVAALQAFQIIGLPEGAIPMAQAVVHCATSPKSNASYKALREAQETVRTAPNAPPPKHLLNAPTALMKKQGYGAGYRYPHDEEDGFAQGVKYLPDELAGRRFYVPTDRGYEAYIRERLQRWRGNDG